MVVLWRIGNLELAAMAQVAQLAREPKSAYHEPWPGRYQPSRTCRQTHRSVTKEVLWLACQRDDAEFGQVVPTSNHLHRYLAFRSYGPLVECQQPWLAYCSACLAPWPKENLSENQVYATGLSPVVLPGTTKQSPARHFYSWQERKVRRCHSQKAAQRTYIAACHTKVMEPRREVVAQKFA